MTPFHVRIIKDDVPLTDSLISRENEMASAFMDKKVEELNEHLDAWTTHRITWRCVIRNPRTVEYYLSIKGCNDTQD